jgi:hypothetical protein
MSADRLYKQAIKRVFGEKYHDEHMAVYWGRDDDTIHVITSFRHYVHKIVRDKGIKRTRLSSSVVLAIEYWMY